MNGEAFKKLWTLLDCDEGPCVCINGRLLVNCNDFFAPAADAEEVEFHELGDFFNRVSTYQEAMEWVARKRGIKCEHWRAKSNSKP